MIQFHYKVSLRTAHKMEFGDNIGTHNFKYVFITIMDFCWSFTLVIFHIFRSTFLSFLKICIWAWLAERTNFLLPFPVTWIHVCFLSLCRIVSLSELCRNLNSMNESGQESLNLPPRKLVSRFISLILSEK